MLAVPSELDIDPAPARTVWPSLAGRTVADLAGAGRPVTEQPASICDVLPAAAAVLGVPGAADRLGLLDGIGPVRQVVVVLVDGMGFQLLPALAPQAPLLASILAGTIGQLTELTCTFPSTTPTSLVSLGTGARRGSTASSGSP